jgi:hypothetical protein
VIPCIFPCYGDFILRKEILVSQERVQTVPPVKTGREKRDMRSCGKKKMNRTMHQCEGYWFLRKGQPQLINKEKIGDVIIDSCNLLVEPYPGSLDKCELTVPLYPPYVHAYRTTPNALTTTVKGITSDNTSHPPTKVSRMVI